LGLFEPVEHERRIVHASNVHAVGLRRRWRLPNPRGACMNRRLHHQLGQGMTEYIIVVALISVAAIGVYTLFGQTIRNQTAGLALEVAGQDAGVAIGNAQTNATSARSSANVRKGLDTYNNNR
jgi:Flp pilus assembly pilin Flp